MNDVVAPAAPAAPAPPAEVTLATCIGCGAMSLSAGCADGCAQERRLELVPAAELHELAALTDRAEVQAAALNAAVAPLVQRRRPRGGYAAEAARARAALSAHGGVETRLRNLAAQPIDPVVSWWCPRCGGIDAPQPCLGVCIRTPVRWANAEAVRAIQARAAALLVRTDRLLSVLTLAACTRPRPGREAQHWAAIVQRARRALSG